MSFFGLRWVPTSETNVRPSEADQSEALEIMETIRRKGQLSAHAAHRRIDAQYRQEYQNYNSAKNEVQQMKEKLSSQIGNLHGQDRKVIVTAAELLVDDDPNFQTATQEMDNASKGLVKEYAKVIVKERDLAAYEDRLWFIHADLQSEATVSALWKFEADCIEKHKTFLEEKAKAARDARARLRQLHRTQAANVGNRALRA